MTFFFLLWARHLQIPWVKKKKKEGGGGSCRSSENVWMCWREETSGLHVERFTTKVNRSLTDQSKTCYRSRKNPPVTVGTSGAAYITCCHAHLEIFIPQNTLDFCQAVCEWVCVCVFLNRLEMRLAPSGGRKAPLTFPPLADTVQYSIWLVCGLG